MSSPFNIVLMLLYDFSQIRSNKKREIFPFQLILYQTDGHLHLQDLEQYNHSH